MAPGTIDPMSEEFLSPDEGASTAPPAEDKRRSRRVLGILGVLLASILAISVAAVAFLMFNLQKAIDRSTEGKGGSVIDIIAPGPAVAQRTNILIAGSSFDDPGHAGGELTDGIMIASLDPDKNKITLVSVPRDLWVTYQGRGMKINALYVSAGKGAAGFEALDKTLEEVTGLHIDHNVLVGVQAFQGVVDALGGVDVVIASTDARGIGDPNIGIYLSNGPHHLDGKTALQLARARNVPVPGKEAYGLPDSDYSRQQNQRLILSAVVEKAKASLTTNPLALTAMFDQLSQHTRTDLTVAQIKTLVDQGSKAKSQSSITIRGHRNAPLLTNYAAPDRSSAQIPKAGVSDYSEIKAFVWDALRE